MGYFKKWIRDAHGELVHTVAGGEIRAIPVLDGWTLEGPDILWFSHDLNGLQGMAEFLEGYMERKAARKDQADVRVTEDLGDGFTLSGHRFKGTSFNVTVSLDGKQVGYYQGFLNFALSTFVLGQDAIQGSEWLHDCARRRGFGDKMRDMAERITGLPAVPHRRNFAPGSLSDAAAKSWDKRAKVKDVLGHGDDMGVKIRTALVEKNFQNIARFRHGAVDLLSAMALAEKTGLPMMLGFSRGEASCGWVIGEGGLPLEPTGRLNPNTLKKFAFDYAYADSPIKFKQMSFRKADAVLKGDWRSELNDFHQQHAERMVNLVASPRYKELQNLVNRPSDLPKRTTLEIMESLKLPNC